MGRSCQGLKVISLERWTAPPWILAHPSVAQDADDAMPASSWTSLERWKERDWRSIDLGEAGGRRFFCRTEGGSVDPKKEDGPMVRLDKDHKAGSEELKGAENEKQESDMEEDEATLQEASVEVQKEK